MEAKLTLSIDWEDFGQLINRDYGGGLEKVSSDIERQTKVILDLLDKNNAKATFFVLGILAEKRKSLVKEIFAKGHEIALHSYTHPFFSQIDLKESFKELQTSKDIVEQIVGNPVKGFRAPYFSIVEKNLNVLDQLVELGFEYDSSIFPKKMPRYGIDGFGSENRIIQTPGGNSIVELPITLCQSKWGELPIAGGGYMRILPKPMLKYFYRKMEKEKCSPMIYMHPYEFDTKRIDIASCFDQSIKISPIHHTLKNLKWNLNRKSITPKIDYLLGHHKFATCIEKSNYVKQKTIGSTILG